MIEDALKRTRQAYFLILAIVAITVLFSFAIKKPNELVDKKELLEKIIKLDLNNYDNFANKKITTKLAEDSSNIFKSLDTLSLPVFGINKIKQAFQDLDYSGRLIIKNSIFSDLSKCKPSQLRELNNLDVDQEILWFVPDLNKLEKEIVSFLEENSSIGLSVTNVRIDSYRSDNDASTFDALEDPSVSIYFELTSSVMNSAIPTFSAEVYGDIDTLPNTSLVSWMKNQTYDEELISVRNDSIVWASRTYNYPINERDLSFSELLKQVDVEIEKFIPENQKISFLGLEIKGSLIFIASPILIMMMMYFLFSNLLHLEKIVQNNETTFKEFSWNAINGTKLKRMEIISVILVAPMSCLGYLFYSLIQASNLNFFLLGFIAVSIIGNLLMGKLIIQHLYFLQCKLNEG